MAKNFPVNPKHPERICWGATDIVRPSRWLAAMALKRTMHPAELFGEDWCVPGDWGIEMSPPQLPAAHSLKPLKNG